MKIGAVLSCLAARRFTVNTLCPLLFVVLRSSAGGCSKPLRFLRCLPRLWCTVAALLRPSSCHKSALSWSNVRFWNATPAWCIALFQCQASLAALVHHARIFY